MWPHAVDWKDLRFGVEIEFIGGRPGDVALLPGWRMALDEHQVDGEGCESGSELQSPRLRWGDRAEIGAMLAQLRAAGAVVNWSCGLHVHVGIEPWGQDMVLPLLNAALVAQDALRRLLRTPEHRMIYCLPVTPTMRERYQTSPDRDCLVHRGRPQSHRCGINTAAWFDKGTVEIRYPNATLDESEVLRTVELCLRFVAGVGAGLSFPAEAEALARVLGAPESGYPAPLPAPLWYREQAWLEAALIPVLAPLCEALVPEGEILAIRPIPGGALEVAVEHPANRLLWFHFTPVPSGWTVWSSPGGVPLAIRRTALADAPVVRDLLHRAHTVNLTAGFNFSAATISLEKMEEWIAEGEGYVLTEGDQIVGTVTLWPERSLGALGVDPERGGAGYGTKLIAFAENCARRKGWTRLRLDTPVTHPWLPRFYRQLGYEPVGVTHWEGKKYDSVIMEKAL
jgi:GNAT superfamily N-acetyltransferase